MSKTTIDTKLIEALPNGWIQDLANEFDVSRQNLRKMLKNEINSERAQEIRIAVAKRLKENTDKAVKVVLQIEA